MTGRTAGRRTSTVRCRAQLGDWSDRPMRHAVTARGETVLQWELNQTRDARLLLPGDSERFDRLARALLAVADDALPAVTEAMDSAASHSGKVWSGQAGDALRGELQELVRTLEGLSQIVRQAAVVLEGQDDAGWPPRARRRGGGAGLPERHQPSRRRRLGRRGDRRDGPRPGPPGPGASALAGVGRARRPGTQRPGLAPARGPPRSGRTRGTPSARPSAVGATRRSTCSPSRRSPIRSACSADRRPTRRTWPGWPGPRERWWRIPSTR